MDQSFFIAIAPSSGVLVIINLFGNTLVCVAILRNQNMRAPMNYLLFNLAVVDATIGVFSIPMIVLHFNSNEAEGTVVLLLCQFIVYENLIHTCSTISAYSLAAVSFERYQAVVHPLTVRENVTKRKTLVFIFIAWILAIGLKFPWFIGIDLDKSVPGRCKVKTDYKEAIETYSYIFGVLAYGVPLVIMSVLYAQVLREFLKKQDQIIEQNQQVAFQTKKRIAGMLITVTLIFAIRVAVGTAFHIVYRYTSFGALVIGLLLLINSSINWILYALFSKQFRSCFKKALCSCSRKQELSGCYPRVKENSLRKDVVDTRL